MNRFLKIAIGCLFIVVGISLEIHHLQTAKISAAHQQAKDKAYHHYMTDSTHIEDRKWEADTRAAEAKLAQEKENARLAKLPLEGYEDPSVYLCNELSKNGQEIKRSAVIFDRNYSIIKIVLKNSVGQDLPVWYRVAGESSSTRVVLAMAGLEEIYTADGMVRRLFPYYIGRFRLARPCEIGSINVGGNTR